MSFLSFVQLVIILNYLSVFLILKRIPHTASNKIDRTALAEVYKNVDIVSWEQILGSHATDKGSELIDDPRLIEIMEKLSVVIAELTSVSIESIQSSTLLPAVGIDSVSGMLMKIMLPTLNGFLNLDSFHPTSCQITSKEDGCRSG
jgi:hypothetical protein